MTTGGSCMGTTTSCVDGDDDINRGSGGLTTTYVVVDEFGGMVEEVVVDKISS